LQYSFSNKLQEDLDVQQNHGSIGFVKKYFKFYILIEVDHFLFQNPIYALTNGLESFVLERYLAQIIDTIFCCFSVVAMILRVIGYS